MTVLSRWSAGEFALIHSATRNALPTGRLCMHVSAEVPHLHHSMVDPPSRWDLVMWWGAATLLPCLLPHGLVPYVVGRAGARSYAADHVRRGHWLRGRQLLHQCTSTAPSALHGF